MANIPSEERHTWPSHDYFFLNLIGRVQLMQVLLALQYHRAVSKTILDFFQHSLELFTNVTQYQQFSIIFKSTKKSPP